MILNLPVVLAVLPAVVVGLVLPLAIVGLVAYGIAELVRAGSDRPDDGGADPVAGAHPSGSGVTSVNSPAIAILDERFARGEIDTEDYVGRRELLLASVGTEHPTSTVAAADPSSEVAAADRNDTVDGAPTTMVDGAPTATVDGVPADTVDAARRRPRTRRGRRRHRRSTTRPASSRASTSSRPPPADPPMTFVGAARSPVASPP